MALCYNLGRVLNILGLERWLAVLAKHAADLIRVLFSILHDAVAAVRLTPPSYRHANA